MSPVTTQVRPPAGIVAYLGKHPDIFVEHPELLSGLNLPHLPGRNISSLLEYQVVRLRRETEALRHHIAALESAAAHSHRVTGAILTLALQILAARTPADLYKLLRRDLQTYYAADHVLLLIFTRAPRPTGPAGLKYCDTRSGLCFMFAELFQRDKPLCGSLQEEHVEALFGKHAATIKSTVLLPHAGAGWQSLLALGSHTENCYGRGAELDLLLFLNKMLNSMIAAYLHA